MKKTHDKATTAADLEEIVAAELETVTGGEVGAVRDAYEANLGLPGGQFAAAMYDPSAAVAYWNNADFGGGFGGGGGTDHEGDPIMQ